MTLKSCFILGLLWSTFSLSAFAEIRAFSGEAEWNGSGVLNVLDIQGVQMNAIEKAASKCRAAGMRYCVFKNMTLSKHNSLEWSESYKCKRHFSKVTAIVHGYNLDVAGETQVYSNNSRWNSDASHAELDTLGIRMTALDNALNECYHKFQHCGILDTSVIASNTRFHDETYSRERNYTEAQANVIGFNLFP